MTSYKIRNKKNVISHKKLVQKKSGSYPKTVTGHKIGYQNMQPVTKIIGTKKIDCSQNH